MWKENKGKIVISSIIILLPVLIGVLLWNQLPDVMATHWGVSGEADGFNQKPFVVFGMPLILLGIHLVSLYITRFGKSQIAQNKKIVNLIFWLVPIVSMFVFAMIYAAALEKSIDVAFVGPLFAGLLFIVMGNYLPKVKRNYVIGIKLPWTLKDEENWNKTHRLSGKLWVLGGFVVLVGAFINGEAAFAIMLAALALMVFVPTVYSYALYKKSIKAK